ncbi:MAG: DUF5666 domain-containing protein [Candidatus Sulfotelmatobacter sp.]
MKQTILLLAFAALAAPMASAHGTDQHVMGTVTAMADNSITVQTGKETVTVYTMAETKFVKSGIRVSIRDLKVGDRVVIHAGKMDDKLMAHEVRFGPTEKRE